MALWPDETGADTLAQWYPFTTLFVDIGMPLFDLLL